MSVDLVILGTSVRAAAQSARRSGYEPAGADLFADVDLLECGPAVRVEDYPQGLVRAAAAWPSIAWMYTGAIENHLTVVERVSAGRPLWGNDVATLRRVRDPWRLDEALRGVGLSLPEMRRDADDVPRDGTWLRKAARSGGGTQVAPWDANSSTARPPRGSYFQRRIEGQLVAAIFVANGRAARLLGVSTQRPLDEENGDFRYAGSTTELPNHDQIAEQFERGGAAIAAEFGLSGIFGIDAVHDSNTLWPIEVNPRYTASVEIIERSGGFDAIALHAAACADARLPDWNYQAPSRHVAKVIHFAEREVTIDERFADWAKKLNADGDWPTIADIPAAGSEIKRGLPVTTLLAEADSLDELARREATLLDGLRRMIYEN